MEEILKLLEQDARLTPEQIATMCSRPADEVRQIISDLESSGTILSYGALIDWDKTQREYVSALIELKVTPKKDRGFDHLAEIIDNYPEVKSVYLMSGGYDLSIILEGKTMRDVAFFVAGKLSTIEGVVSTATHFVLKKYKDRGVIYQVPAVDERGL